MINHISTFTGIRLLVVFTIITLLTAAFPAHFLNAQVDENPEIPGCTDTRANNYEPTATVDDGSCTVTVKFVKKFDGVDLGFTPEQFSFLVTGSGFSEELEHNEEFEFTAGSYTVEEIGPDSFSEADWRIKWTCPDVYMTDDDDNDHDATFDVTSDNYKDGSIFCTAENQYRPDNNGTSTEPETGSINGHKWNDENGDGIWDSNESGLAGWTIVLNGTESTTTNDHGEFWFTDLKPGTYDVCEVQKADWTQTAPATNAGCYEVTVTDGEEKDINFGNQEDDEPNQCVPESPAWADNVVSSDQGDTKGNGAITDVNRTDPTKVLGASDWSNGGSTGFFSLGFGGSVVVEFGPNGYVTDEDGDDISIHEATNGTGYPEETALVEVSQNGSDWYEVGTASNQTDVNTRVSYFDFSGTGLSWIRYVRVTDTTDSSLHNDAADGFDLDAVDATKNVCEEPEPEMQCIIEGHKYDETGVPLSGWVIGLGGEFYEYTDNDSGGEYVYENYTDTTDENGYYCIEEYRNDQDQLGRNYIVGELMQSGWSFFDVTVDGSSTTLASTPDSFFDVWVEIDLPAVDETLTVDFYNQNNGGGNGGDTYRIEGYVWHDDNENTIWDGFDDGEEEQEIVAEDEQAGWTVNITNGSVTYSTTTDETGFYYFEVPAGTWTITEEVMNGWELITPASGSHVVTVPALVTQSISSRLLAWLMPTAHAAVVDTYGLFNFGNNEASGGGGCTSGCGGGGPKIELGGGSSNNDNGGNNPGPTPQVAGEQVSVVPHGAPNAGGGGTSPSQPLRIPGTWFSAIVLTGRALYVRK